MSIMHNELTLWSDFLDLRCRLFLLAFIFMGGEGLLCKLDFIESVLLSAVLSHSEFCKVRIETAKQTNK